MEWFRNEPNPPMARLEAELWYFEAYRADYEEAVKAVDTLKQQRVISDRKVVAGIGLVFVVARSVSYIYAVGVQLPMWPKSRGGPEG